MAEITTHIVSHRRNAAQPVGELPPAAQGAASRCRSVVNFAAHSFEPETAMNPTAETLSAQAVQLPPEERVALVERILDSLDEPDASLDALWAKEADDRLAAYRRGEIRAVALSDVVAKYQVIKKPE